MLAEKLELINYSPRMLCYHACSCPAITHSPCIMIARPLRRWTMPFFPWSTCVPSMAFNYMSFFRIVLKNNILKEKSGQPQPQANLLMLVYFSCQKEIKMSEKTKEWIIWQKVSIYFELGSYSCYKGRKGRKVENDSALLFLYLLTPMYFLTLEYFWIYI